MQLRYVGVFALCCLLGGACLFVSSASALDLQNLQFGTKSTLDLKPLDTSKQEKAEAEEEKELPVVELDVTVPKKPVFVTPFKKEPTPVVLPEKTAKQVSSLLSRKRVSRKTARLRLPSRARVRLPRAASNAVTAPNLGRTTPGRVTGPRRPSGTVRPTETVGRPLDRPTSVSLGDGGSADAPVCTETDLATLPILLNTIGDGPIAAVLLSSTFAPHDTYDIEVRLVGAPDDLSAVEYKVYAEGTFSVDSEGMLTRDGDVFRGNMPLPATQNEIDIYVRVPSTGPRGPNFGFGQRQDSNPTVAHRIGTFIVASGAPRIDVQDVGPNPRGPGAPSISYEWEALDPNSPVINVTRSFTLELASSQQARDGEYDMHLSATGNAGFALAYQFGDRFDYSDIQDQGNVLGVPQGMTDEEQAETDAFELLESQRLDYTYTEGTLVQPETQRYTGALTLPDSGENTVHIWVRRSVQHGIATRQKYFYVGEFVIRNATLERLTLAPEGEDGIGALARSMTVDRGDEVQFVVQGTYSDGATRTLTDDVTWSMRPRNRVTFLTRSTGLVRADAVGTVTITARYSSGNVTRTARRRLTIQDPTLFDHGIDGTQESFETDGLVGRNTRDRIEGLR